LNRTRQLDTGVLFYADDMGNLYLVRNLFAVSSGQHFGVIVSQLNRTYIFDNVTASIQGAPSIQIMLGDVSLSFADSEANAVFSPAQMSDLSGSIQNKGGAIYFFGEADENDYLLRYAVGIPRTVLYRDYFDLTQVILI